MNTPMKYLAAGVILLVIGLIAGGVIASGASGGRNSDPQQAADVAKVKDVWNEYEASLNAEDLERWSSLWIDDGIQMPPDEPRHIGKAQILAAAQPGFEMFDFEGFTINPAEVRILGDRAYSHGTYGFSMTPKEGETLSRLRASF